MNQYEKGVHTPNYSVMSNIAHILEVPTAYFYTEDDTLAELIEQYNKLNSQQKAELITILTN